MSLPIQVLGHAVAPQPLTSPPSCLKKVLSIALPAIGLVALAFGFGLFAFQSMESGRLIYILSGVACSLGFGSFALKRLKTFLMQSKEEQKATIQRVVQIALIGILAFTALGVGLLGAYSLSNIIFLCKAIQMGAIFPILSGSVSLIFTAGLLYTMIPSIIQTAKVLSRNYEKIVDAITTMLGTLLPDLISWAREDLLNLRAVFSAPENQEAFHATVVFPRIEENIKEGLEKIVDSLIEGSFDPSLLSSLGLMLSAQKIQEHFKTHLPSLSDQIIIEAYNLFPDAVTSGFLKENLPPERLERIRIKQLLSDPRARDLKEVTQAIKEKTVSVKLLEQKPGVSQEEIEEASLNLLSLYVYLPTWDPSFQIPKNETGYKSEEISQIREIKGLLEQITDLVVRLQKLWSDVSQYEIEDAEQSNFDALGAYGFTIAIFSGVEERLGISGLKTRDPVISRVAKCLNHEYGLSTRGSLFQAGILRPPPPKESKIKIDLKSIIDRLVEVCKKIKAKRKGAGQRRQTMEKVAKVACVILSGSLLMIHFAYQGLDILLGAVFETFRCLKNPRRHSFSIISGSPSLLFAIGGELPSLTECIKRVHTQFIQISSALFWGEFGGFLSGIRYVHQIEQLFSVS